MEVMQVLLKKPHYPWNGRLEPAIYAAPHEKSIAGENKTGTRIAAGDASSDTDQLRI
jgi:hypothetical protein